MHLMRRYMLRSELIFVSAVTLILVLVVDYSWAFILTPVTPVSFRRYVQRRHDGPIFLEEPRRDLLHQVSEQRRILSSNRRGEKRGRNTAMFASRDQRSPFSWDEEVLDQTIKDILVDRAIKTLRHYWSETGGDLYGRWMEKFSARQNLGDDVIFRMGWSRFLLKLMREDPEEAVVVRMAKKDSKQVLEKRRQNSERPPTLSPWRHTVEQLSADWEAEEEEEMKVSLDHPPQLKAVSSSVVVQPVEIAKKIMDVRETLASEWREDLLNIELENKEIAQVVSEKAVLGVENAERNRRLTNDLGDTFGGDSSPYRSENYEALVNYVTEIGAIAVQEKMRQNGDSMGWNWMEQFLYWTKANARSGSVGMEAAGDPPLSPTVGIGSVDEGRGARSKTVTATFGEGVAGGGMYETEAEKKMRGNRLLEELMMGQKVQMFDTETGELVGVDPAQVGDMVMAARSGVAERVCAVLETVPEDHGLVMRKYLQERWQASLYDGGSLEEEEDDKAGDGEGGTAE